MSHQLIKNQLETYKDLNPLIAFTKLDESEIFPRELSLVASGEEEKIRVSLYEDNIYQEAKAILLDLNSGWFRMRLQKRRRQKEGNNKICDRKQLKLQFYYFSVEIRFSIKFSTTEGSARVEVSPILEA